ncbi:MAG: hypothetical protein KC917_20290, partial [Candidatus Omnitrophica bacterium]|nr:hypothetical protein [Candidatus Omnitrophota bacterium]
RGFFLNDSSFTEIYTISLLIALSIAGGDSGGFMPYVVADYLSGHVLLIPGGRFWGFKALGVYNEIVRAHV